MNVKGLKLKNLLHKWHILSARHIPLLFIQISTAVKLKMIRWREEILYTGCDIQLNLLQMKFETRMKELQWKVLATS